VALDRSFVGRTFSLPDPYVVGIEKIREFATAIGDDNPISHRIEAARAAGHDGLVGSPTFAIVAISRAQDSVMFNPDLGLDFARVVHGEQRFLHHRPIIAGDVLTCSVTVDAIRALGSNDMLTLRAELMLEDGTPVTTAVSSLVARGTPVMTASST
jgi:acyl dehydratase